MRDDITIDIFTKNDDDPDFGDFAENIEGPASQQGEPDDDDGAQECEELRKAVSQLFFCVCTLFEAVQGKAAETEKEGGEDVAASLSEPRSQEACTSRTSTPWWAWANLGLSGIVLLALFASLVF